MKFKAFALTPSGIYSCLLEAETIRGAIDKAQTIPPDQFTTFEGDRFKGEFKIATGVSVVREVKA